MMRRVLLSALAIFALAFGGWMLLREPGVRVVPEALMRTFDPALDCLRDCNTPDAYREALRIAGFDP